LDHRVDHRRLPVVVVGVGLLARAVDERNAGRGGERGAAGEQQGETCERSKHEDTSPWTRKRGPRRDRHGEIGRGKASMSPPMPSGAVKWEPYAGKRNFVYLYRTIPGRAAGANPSQGGAGDRARLNVRFMRV